MLAVVIVLSGTALWFTLYPVLFPARMKAPQAQYQKWLAEHSSTDK